MPIPTRVKARFALITAGRLLLGAGALFRAVEIYRGDSSATSPVVALGVLVIGLLLLWWAVVGVRALLARDSLTDATIIASSVAEVDKRAPSGLKPLWIALVIILGAFLLWVLVAGLIGAT